MCTVCKTFADAAARIVGIGAHARKHRNVHCQQPAVGIDREPAADPGVTGMNVANEGFQAVGGELHWPAEQHRDSRSRHFVRIGCELHAEGAADVGRDDADLGQRQAELRGKHIPHLVRDLMRMVDRQLPDARIEFGDDRTRFERHAGLALEDKVMLDHDRGLGKGLLRSAARKGMFETDVADLGAVDGRCTIRARRFDTRHRRQFFPLDRNQLNCVFCLRACCRNSRDHGFALPADFAASQRMLRRRTVHREGHEPCLPGLADRREVVTCDDGNHARREFGCRGVDRDDARMRVWAPQKRDVAQVGDVEVVGVAAPALRQPFGVAARDAASDEAARLAHGFEPARARATASTASTIA